MRKFSILAMVAAFILGTVALASAVEMKARGSFRVHANWTDNYNLEKTKQDNESEDDFNVYQRARVYFDFIANENVKAVLGFEIGDLTWGTDGQAQLGTDEKGIIEVKHAYLDFKLPETEIDVKAGLQGITLPNNLGSAILSDDMAALVLNIPVNDMFSVTAGWARLYNNDATQKTTTTTTVDNNGTDAISPFEVTTTTTTTPYNYHDEDDMAFLVLPIKMDGYTITPFGAYAWIGKDSSLSADPKKDSHAYWLGVSGKVTAIDPIVVMFDLNYGKLNADNDTYDASGWFMDLAVDYKMDMMTPELFFLYSSGEDSNIKDGHEVMPIISPDITATSFGFDGSALAHGGNIIHDANNNNYLGLWALGLKLKDISFMENLSHTLTFMYGKGTSDKDYVNNGGDDSTLTTKDSFTEFDFDTKYKMYENLAAIVELGYAKINYDEDLGTRGNNYKDQAAWKLAVGVKYNF
ncbi:MAG: outer membrane homotrimeric porin [Desulfonauticus sp.]|nr:outer membrane homotrimeric porin [Desulfonauticus sp.]